MNQKILIIEDDIDLRQNFKEILEFNRFMVSVASNGNEALALLAKEECDLIISDILMPGMDGIVLLSEVKKLPNYSNIPFIFLSGKASKEDHRLGMELGADDYLFKPISGKILLQVIFSSLEKKQKREEWVNYRLEHALKENRKITFHEFRTPLAGVLGAFEMLELMLDSFDKAEFSDLIFIGKNSANRINESLNKLSLYNRLKTLSPSFQKIEFDLTFLKCFVSGFCERFNLNFGQESLQLLLDKELFSFVLKEIIENALKFSLPETNISIEVKNDYFKLTNYQQVDKTIGDYIPRAFSQVNRNFIEQQGLGLGLFLSKEIIAALKGRFMCEIDSDYRFIVSMDLGCFKSKE